MSTTTRRRAVNRKLRRTAQSEPVALAGAIRALLYALLGTQLDARTMTEVVVIAETLVGMVVRQFVTPTKRRTPRAGGRRSPATATTSPPAPAAPTISLLPAATG
jgi:hypothetical protein